MKTFPRSAVVTPASLSPSDLTAVPSPSNQGAGLWLRGCCLEAEPLSGRGSWRPQHQRGSAKAWCPTWPARDWLSPRGAVLGEALPTLTFLSWKEPRVKGRSGTVPSATADTGPQAFPSLTQTSRSAKGTEHLTGVSFDTHPQLGTQDVACGHLDSLGVSFQPLHSLQAFSARKVRLSPALCTLDLERGGR